jgi:hypothetical protein
MEVKEQLVKLDATQLHNLNKFELDRQLPGLIRNSTMSSTTLVLCVFYLSNMLLGS